MKSVKIIWVEKDVLKFSPASFPFPPLLTPVFHGKPVGRKEGTRRASRSPVGPVPCQPPPLRFPDLGTWPLWWAAKSGCALVFISYSLLSWQLLRAGGFLRSPGGLFIWLLSGLLFLAAGSGLPLSSCWLLLWERRLPTAHSHPRLCCGPSGPAEVKQTTGKCWSGTALPLQKAGIDLPIPLMLPLHENTAAPSHKQMTRWSPSCAGPPSCVLLSSLVGALRCVDGGHLEPEVGFPGHSWTWWKLGMCPRFWALVLILCRTQTLIIYLIQSEPLLEFLLPRALI